MRASPHWQQQQQQQYGDQQQQQYGGQQQQHQVSPMSAGLSPGWVPDPVAQALQGEVDRLRQQVRPVQAMVVGVSFVPAGVLPHVCICVVRTAGLHAGARHSCWV
jgi:hypothetical protein